MTTPRLSPTLFRVELVSLGLRHLLGWILMSAALEKALHRQGFQETLQRYPGVSARTSRRLALALPAVELVIASALFTGLWYREAAFVLAILLAVFSIAILGAMRRGVLQDCGCGGVLPVASVGGAHLLVNVLLATAAAIVSVISQTTAALEAPKLLAPVSAEQVTPASALVVGTAMSAAVSLWAFKSIAQVKELRIRLDTVRMGG